MPASTGKVLRMADESDTEHLTFEHAWLHAEGANGWLTRAQGSALFDAARAVPANHWIVEIGSHCGRSTVVLAAAKLPQVPLLAVDPFDDPRWGGGAEALDEFERTLQSANLLEEVRTFRGLSREAADAGIARPVALLFVDGAHDRASVLTDIDGWTPHLVDHATLLFHDAYSAPGVTIALFERYFGVARAQYLGSIGSLARIDLGDLTFRERFASAARMLGRLSWFARNLAVKISLRRGWLSVHRALGHPEAEYPH